MKMKVEKNVKGLIFSYSEVLKDAKFVIYLGCA